MTTRIYNVPGISCAHCKAAIEGEVSEIGTVDEVVVDIDARTVTVEGDAQEADIRGAIEEAGYEVASSA